MTPHADTMTTTPEYIAADDALIAVAQAVAKAVKALAAARDAVTEMEIALCEAGRCGSGCP